MRTKVERKQRVLEEKLKLNMPSPKVVLDASDCARLLDGADKTSVVVVEREGKIVAASSLAASSDPNTGLGVGAKALPVLKSPTSENSNLSGAKHPGQPTMTEKHSAVSEHMSISNSTGEQKEKWTKTEAKFPNKKDGLVSGREASSEQTKAILKPPKKRRGIEVEFEVEASSQCVLNNGVIDAPLTQYAAPNQMASESNLSKSSQRHSVERILQHNPVHSPKSHNNLVNLQPPLSARMEVATSSAETSVPSSHYSSSTKASHQVQPPPPPYLPSSSSEQIHTQHLPYPPSALQSAECATHQQLLPKNSSSYNNTLTHDNALSSPLSNPVIHTSVTAASDKGSLQKVQTLSKDEEEPMNLLTVSNSTPGESVVSPVTSHASFMTPAEGATTPAEVSEPALRTLSTFTSTEKCVSNPQLSSSRATTSDNAICDLSDAPYKQSHSAPDLTLNKSTKCANPSDVVVQTQPPLSSFNMGTVLPHSPPSEDHAHCNSVTSSHSVAIENHNPPYPASLEIKGQQKEEIEDCRESCDPTNKADSIEPEHNTTESTQHSATDTLVSKCKKSSRKKPEIPMDDASCTQRLIQYALTIDDVIANFVYVPEPVEEMRLTEEEELALRDQFDDTDESYNSEKLVTPLTDSSDGGQGQTRVKDSSAATLSLTVQTAETQTTIYPSESLPKKRSSKPEKESQADPHGTNQTHSNIDSVLAAVASDLTKPIALATAAEMTAADKVKKKKKKNVLKKESQAEEEGKIVLSDKPNELKQHGSKKLVDSSHSDQIGSEKTDSLSSDKQHAQAKSALKPKKAKKRKSGHKSSGMEQSGSIQPETISGKEEPSEGPVKKKKKVVKKPKVVKDGADHPVKHSASPIDSSAELTSLLDVNKDFLGANKGTETSDIGESIASTSGGSEQDTPIHESELISGKPCLASQNGGPDKDKDSQDTGLESSGGEDSSLNKPLRRYKKRLDFVKCDQCEHQARGRSALSRHMKKVHQVEVDMPHKCPHCSYGCSKQASLNRHLFTHGVFSCSRCTFVGETRLALTQHVLENHRDKLDLKLCKICNRYIKCDQLTIEEHTSKCQGPTPFKCTVCDKEFKYGSSLRVHYHTHFPDQPKKFKCELCEYRTNYKANLHKHHKNMHAVKGKEIQCPDCGKLFSTEDNMRRHRKVHTLARPFACETCKKTFKTSGALKGHQLIHTATRPYTCTITGCNRSFRTPKFLKSHQEEFHRLVPKKFFCSVDGCNYSFFKRSHLKRHAITHTGERNFHCTWPGCSKSFRHSDNLKVHFRAHTTEKVLQCHLCEFKTKQKNSMYWHKKKVHQVVEASKSATAASTKSNASDEPAAKPEAPTDTVSAPEVAESGCQTALALSDDHSEDGSFMESPAQNKVKVSVVQCAEETGRIGSHESTKVESKAKAQATKEETAEGAESRGSKDLYEFKSDDESEEEAPGTFRRDLIPKEELTPLPPPPKELLMRNEMEEQREQARKEKEEKKELEKQERLQKKEQEKKEKAEKRELEKKEKIEKKEMEKKEKIEKKEQEKKEKIEKKELEKKEKEEKKELEKKERIEKKETEKKEKIEQRELEKKEKAEKKEQEKREKLEKKELEMKEKEEKREKEKKEKEQARIEKEQAKKEREEQRKAKEQLRLEKEKERERKKAEKEKQELGEAEKKENKDKTMPESEEKTLKPGKKAQKKAKVDSNGRQMSPAPRGTSDGNDAPENRGEDKRKMIATRRGKKPYVLVRKKSQRRLSQRGEEEEADTVKPKRGRKKKMQEGSSEVTKVLVTRKKKLATETEEEEAASPVKKKRMTKKSAEDAVNAAVSPRSPRSPRGPSPRGTPRQAAVIGGMKKRPGRPSKTIISAGRKKKSLPSTRKMSARIKAKAHAASPSPVKKPTVVKGRRGGKPGPKKKVAEKKELQLDAEEQEGEEDRRDCKSAKEDENVKPKVVSKKRTEKTKEGKVNTKKEKEGLKNKVEVKKISTRGRTAAAAREAGKSNKEEKAEESHVVADRAEESHVVADRAESPAYSEEHMLQGNASPYRGLSDADEEEEEKEKSREEEKSCNPSPSSNVENRGEDEELGTIHHEEHDRTQEGDRSSPGHLKSSEQSKKEDEQGVGQNEDAYSSDDDDVSNDIPLTPPRAPAPPPVESSEDEMEEAVEPEPSAPFSVPGPNTPFSVPGPNTPFSVPGPNTPFSVPGPHTPFSVPPPTNLMQQQHSVPSDDTPLSAQPSVQSSTEIHSHGSVEMQHSQNSVEMHQPQSSVEMVQAQQGSVEMQHQHHSRNSADIHPHNSSSGDITHGTMDMHANNQRSGELHSQVSGEMHPSGPSERNHSHEGAVRLQSEAAGPVDSMHSHRPVEMFSHDSSVEIRQDSSYDPHSEASTLQKLRDEAMNSVKCSEGGDHMSVMDKYQFPHHIGEGLGKYGFPHPLPDHSHAEADKAYFDQYLKNLSSARGGLGPGPGQASSSPTGLQQLEAMVGKSHMDNGGGPKSPLSSLPSGMMTGLENSLAPDGRPLRGDALPHSHEVLYTGRETPSSLSRLTDRQSATTTPLPPSGAPTPAFEAFSHLNSLHAAPPSSAVPGRDNAYLRQADNLFPTPPVSSGFMAEAMFQRQAMSTPFLPPPPPPQTGERSSVLTSHSSSSTLLGRAGTMPTTDMFSASQAMQPTMPRNPFTNAWASQDSRPSHWQPPYLPRQPNMATPGSFFPGKESYLTGREFMFDPTSVRASADSRSMFPSLSGTAQGQDSLPLDRFDLSNYFPNAAAMAPYGSSAAATSLDYTRSGHTSSTKPFDERYRQASVGAGATSGAIPNFRSLPAVSGSGPGDMFHGIPGVNPHFNLYAAAGNPMSYHHHHHHSQHPHHHQLTDSGMNSAFLSHHHHPHHPGSAQHAAMFERDYRGLYPQNAAAAAAAAYPFINERQYPGAASKLGHAHPSVGPSASTSSRTTTQEGQMQDPYRSMLYRY
ncbi:zinc finger protein 37 [Elysia marginata]|uniref:Zinc finger protein 37 n=1 Tax=Elysia marginata TaxID=1093978 RepID=A0AAV4FTU7_9GAST|nr:zinc finger protein 37 [Elysia marginata]